MDYLQPQVIRYIKNRKKISCKALMKQFSVGYARAARILQILEKQGKVSDAKPNRARRVL